MISMIFDFRFLIDDFSRKYEFQKIIKQNIDDIFLHLSVFFSTGEEK